MATSGEFPSLVLNKNQITILRILRSFYEDEEGAEMVTSNDIYELLSGTLSLSSINRILKQLEKLGLVESEVEESGGEKTRYYSLTEHGLEVVNALEKLAASVKQLNELILKRAKFKVVKTGDRYKIKLD